MVGKIIKYVRHARRRMKWRRISEPEVEQTLGNPDKIDIAQKGRKNAFKKVGKRYIRVSYRETENKIIVVSAVDKSD